MDELETIASYLPELARRELGSRPRARRLDTAVLFADISGFTPLTRRLALLGPRGAEQLSEILAGYFGRLQELISAHGGDIVAEAGDALLACWPDHDRAAGVRHAARCATLIRDELDAYDAGGGVTLSIKCSLAAGDVMALDLGGVGGRWMHLVDGPAIGQLAACNELASSGEVVASAAAAAELGPGARTEDLGGPVRLAGLTGTDAAAPLRETAPPPEAAAAVRGYVLPLLTARIDAGQSEWLSEFRTLSTVFVGLGAYDHTAPGSADRLQGVVERIQATLDRFEGVLLRMLGDDKGLTFLIAFGLPGLRHEDDPARAAMAARAALEALSDAGLTAAAGVTTGLVFAGEVKAGTRRFYGLIGPPVNLAARLMTAAGGGILCDEETVRRAGARVGFEPLEPLALKGLAEPVRAARPAGAAAEPAADGPREGRLVGREAEFETLARALAVACDGGRSIVLLEGEAGIGKSRLLGRLAEAAQESGARVLSAVADPIDRSVPYLAWRGAVLAALDWESVAAADPARQRAHVDARLAELGAAGLAPLLDAVLPLELPDTDATRGLTADARAQRTREVLARLLAATAGDGPCLVVVEDAHWLDSLSWALTAHLAGEPEPFALVVAMRPADADAPPAYAQLSGDPRTVRVGLGELDPGDMLALVRERIGVAELSEPVEAILRERAGGHPLFAQELAYALRDAGALDGGGRLADLRLPDTIEGLVTSRIDRLPAPEQLSLKVASVIGRVFPYRTLHDIHPVPADRTGLAGQLDHLDRVALVHPEAGGPEPLHGFHHAIMRDVAYDLLTYAQRRRMHRAVAEWYGEKVAPEERQPALLAYHWSRAVAEGDPPELVSRAVWHLHRAAEQALAGSAHAEAAEHLTAAGRIIGWLPAGSERDALELESSSLLGYALMNVRGYGDPDVERAYRRARELSIAAPRAAALGPALYGMFSFYASRGEYDSAGEIARELRELDDPAARLVGDNSLGLSSVLRGDLEAGAAACRASHLAADADPEIGVLQQYGGDFRGYPRAWLAIAQCLLGRPDDALTTFEEALEVTRWHPYTHGFVLCFAGVPHLRRDVAAVRRHCGDLAELSGRYGFMMLGAIAGIYLGWADAMEGRAEAAAEQIGQSIAIPRFVTLESFMPWYLAILAEAQAAAGRPDEARATVDEGLAMAGRAGGNFYEAELRRIGASVTAAGGDRTGALAELAAAADVARRQGARWWELRIATDRVALDGGEDARRALAEARAAIAAGQHTPVVLDADAALAPAG